MTTRRNYFIIRGPVPPNLFFDRREEVEFLKRQLEMESYGLLVSIIAPFRFGKTSLLRKYISILEKYETVIPVYFPSKLRDDPLGLIKIKLSEKIPEANNILVDDRNNIAKFFRRVNKLLEKHNLWVILVIDEFQNIPRVFRVHGYVSKWSDEDIFDFFRGVTEEYQFGLIVSGSYIGRLLNAISIWNGRFIEMRLGSFPRGDSIVMLRTLFEKSGLKVDDEIAEYIAMSAGDHPYYMQLFGYKLVDLGKINEETLEIAREFVMNNILGIFRKKYREIKKHGKKYIDVLTRISRGATSISYYSEDEWEILWDLEKIGVVYDYKTRVEIPDKLFERFIINVASNRRTEGILPEYTTEYIVAKDLAYREGFKEILISYRSWGPFDIVIMRKLGQHKGIGIQVKSTTSDNVKIYKTELERIIKGSRELELMPIIAVLFTTKNELKYFIADENKTIYHVNEGARRLGELINHYI